MDQDLSRGGIGGWRRRAPPSARLSLGGNSLVLSPLNLFLDFKVFLFLALFLNLSISKNHLRQVLRKTIAVIAAHFPVVVYHHIVLSVCLLVCLLVFFTV